MVSLTSKMSPRIYAKEREVPGFFLEIRVNSRQENMRVLISDKVYCKLARVFSRRN
jgi:hypothetical protein